MKAVSITLAAIVVVMVCLHVAYDQMVEDYFIEVGRAEMKLHSLGNCICSDPSKGVPAGSPEEILEHLATEYDAYVGEFRPRGENPFPRFLHPGIYTIPNETTQESPSDPMLIFKPKPTWYRTDHGEWTVRRDGTVVVKRNAGPPH